VPEGVVLGVPTRWLPLARTGLFSLSGKLRMACEPWIARRSFDGDDDESIADFATRRLGREAAERLVAPLLGGISGADASDVSVRVGFPQLVAMEQQYGSLVRGMIAARVKRTPRESEDVPRSVFLSLKGGIEELVHALVGELRVLGVNLHAASPLRSIDREGDRWRVCAGGGLSLLADDVLLAIPSHRAAPILAPIDARSAEMLATIPFVSTSTVFLAYRRQDIAHPLDATGFVVPQTAGRPIAASTWVSSKWEARAPEGHVLVRVFIGGARGQEMLRRDDETLVDVSRRELGALMGLEATPLWSKVYRMDRVTPQMRVGHASRLRAIRQQLAASAPGVHLAGGGYDGVGIPDCVHQGTEAARVMIEGEPE
jgi:oxygen-dependent protoporphyrinogen oxidase